MAYSFSDNVKIKLRAQYKIGIKITVTSWLMSTALKLLQYNVDVLILLVK